ncbi:hypothetical protein K0M31_020208 [Melipona bicolor]|uniref:Uncharacterized protein n=1 Tax=Melipona bicolor TaxID=60889 RepID=A0AA40G235_9HYME|nr:hypothetical protein K0M31_020208 [Melipona bicolor]
MGGPTRLLSRCSSSKFARPGNSLVSLDILLPVTQAQIGYRRVLERVLARLRSRLGSWDRGCSVPVGVTVLANVHESGRSCSRCSPHVSPGPATLTRMPVRSARVTTTSRCQPSDQMQG